jgi:nucleotide-binding universal stress UspA family protein
VKKCEYDAGSPAESNQGWFLPRAAPVLRAIHNHVGESEMRVLVAIDDDTLINPIVDFVAAAFSHHGTIIKLLHVIEPSQVTDTLTSMSGHGETRKILEERLRSASTLLNEVRNDMHPKMIPSVPIEISVLLGTPHRVILETAEESQSDVIVLGSHGRGDLSRLRISSVSYAVLSHAECAVTIVKPRQWVEDLEDSSKSKHAGAQTLV